MPAPACVPWSAAESCCTTPHSNSILCSDEHKHCSITSLSVLAASVMLRRRGLNWLLLAVGSSPIVTLAPERFRQGVGAHGQTADAETRSSEV